MLKDTESRPFSASSFKQYLAEHKLMATRCNDCGALYLPPRSICPACYSENLEWTEVQGKGRLVGFTVIYIAPTFMLKQGFGRENPYIAGIVEIDQGDSPAHSPERNSVRISARISGVDPNRPQDIQVGMPLEIDFIESQDEADTTYLAFRPIETVA